ncbi:SusD-like starch-binding protein associating with outer membrane [Bacteroides heparinolyticus]|uniref:SusD-like starch-binding protein associating with outer membrane n=1 Tax=Prevotella heparinolytica TaxID=28113 RepID=A0A4R2LNF0_9BACE|nr:RagB/SusD family nutrient uptake outer membrane protein [Bacteroides heparinolyticus]TCO88384.1 SusD-like starch-binding protein associating with outer membrane [Bacteroides heparinolyticus]
MMAKIQKIRGILGILFLSLLSISCQDWLDVSPKSEVKYDDLFSYKNGFKDQLTGIYTALCADNLYGANLTFGMADALGQQYVWKQEAGTYYHLHRFEYENTTSRGVINNVWSSMYNAIANINIFLQGIDEHRGVLSEVEENVYEGEAYALRAFLHFDLLRWFGKSYVSGAGEKAIPYVKGVSKEVTPLSTVSECIDLVIEDLKRALDLLAVDPIKTGDSATNFLGTRDFHFNYYATCALLARAYLYKNDKSNALRCAHEVIESNKYPWVESTNVTTNTRETRDGIFKSECIFTLNNTRLKSLTERFLKEGESNTVGNLLIMSPEVCAEIFETNLYGFDWRYNYYFETLSSYYLGSTKLWQFSSNYNNRQPLLRISEMWLIAAECAATKKDAVNCINTLRRHRGFDEGGMLAEEGTTDVMLKTIIGKEYRKEFIGEGQWFLYCKRLDIEEIPNVTVPFSKGFYILPMPDQEKEYGSRK